MSKSARMTGSDLPEGWGVFCNGPHHVAGVYPTREAAEARAEELGALYRVAYCKHVPGVGFTDDFVYSTPKS